MHIILRRLRAVVGIDVHIENGGRKAFIYQVERKSVEDLIKLRLALSDIQPD